MANSHNRQQQTQQLLRNLDKPTLPGCLVKANRSSKTTKTLVCFLASTVILVLSTYSNSVWSLQGHQERLCSNPLTSVFCKAGQAVITGAQQFASSIINRPKHWGVPDNERLDLSDDFSRDYRPPTGQPRPNNFDFINNNNNNFRRRERIHCVTLNGARGLCRPVAVCYHRHGNNLHYSTNDGQCPRDSSLVCCPRDRRHSNDEHQSSRPSFSFLPVKFGDGPGFNIPLGKIRDIIGQVFLPGGDPELRRSNEIERNVINEGFVLRRNSPSDQHQRFIGQRGDKETLRLARDGSDFLAVATRLAQTHQSNNHQDQQNNCRKVTRVVDGSHVTLDECQPNTPTTHPQDNNNKPRDRTRSALPDIDFSETSLASRCPSDPNCNPNVVRQRYRSYDGSCNNLKHTAWGKANTPYSRILPADYEDGVNEVRTTGASGHVLPNPRTLSLSTTKWAEKSDAKTSVLLMQWGQFVDHDLSLAATTPMDTPEGTNIDCCNRKILSDPRFKHPACISILLPDNDPFYSKFRVGCMNLVRSAPSPPIHCRLRSREQLNQLTHFLDASMIYGNEVKQTNGLRTFFGGLMKSSRINGMEFLPFDARVGEGCVLPVAGINRGMRCFVGGDHRLNELTGLATMHALMLREHNRIARILGAINREWNDEKVFQETRRIIIATIQHITYNEFLPIIVGPTIMKDFNLELSQTNGGYSLAYDPNTNPSIINEFAGAAYRLHSLVTGSFNFQTERGDLIQKFQLRNIFNNPASLYRQGNYDGCLNGMINDASQSLDNVFTEELTNHLFQDTNSSFGMDLVAVNIQRGRDHGLPGYNFFRQACGLKRINNFHELESVLVGDAASTLSRLYAHVDDIDLFVAGNYEKKLRDAVVGPVFACIIGEQFRRSRAGDRYWFENGNQAGAFSPNQLAEIKRTSIARIICDNSETIENVQPLAFLKPTEWNQKTSCNQIPWMDLRWWKSGREPPFDPFTFVGTTNTNNEPDIRRADDDGLD